MSNVTYQAVNALFLRRSYLRFSQPCSKAAIFVCGSCIKRYFSTVLNADAVLGSTEALDTRYTREAALREVIQSTTTAAELLELYGNFKDTKPMVYRNRVEVLCSLANIVKKDKRQAWVQSLDANHTPQGSQGHLNTLLSHLFRDIHHSNEHDLALMLWSLGNIGGKKHPLVKACENKIVSSNTASFSPASLSQILSGFASLNMKKTKFFALVQKAVIEGKICLSDLRNQGLVGFLWSFSKTGNGSAKMFELFYQEIDSRDILTFKEFELGQLLFAFAKQNVRAEKLFFHTEQRIFQQGVSNFTDIDLYLVLWAFAASSQSGRHEQLFLCLEKELISRNIQGFKDSELAHIVWSFTKQGVKHAKIYDVVKGEILRRGFEGFHKNVFQLLWSYANAQRPNCAELYHQISQEFLSIGTGHLNNKLLSLYASYFGKVGVENREVFQSIENEILKRNASKMTFYQMQRLLQGFALSSSGSKEFFELLETRMVKMGVSNMTSTEVSNILWSFAKAGFKVSLLQTALEKANLSEST